MLHKGRKKAEPELEKRHRKVLRRKEKVTPAPPRSLPADNPYEQQWYGSKKLATEMGDLQGAYSRRINIKHRLVYEVFEEEQTVKIISLWTHYEF